MEKFPKFQEYQNVVVSGSLTGIGDVKGLITEVKYYEIDESFYYNVKCFGVNEIFFSHEKFLSLEREIK